MPPPSPSPEQSPQPKRWPTAGEKALALGHFDREVDGYHYWFPPGLGGGLSADDLRSIADELDKINADWDKEFRLYFGDD
jgi:hypothetical protein